MNQQAIGHVPLIDSHAHLGYPDYDGDRDGVLQRARAAGLIAMITIGIEQGEWAQAIEMAHLNHDIYAAVGIHPNSADQATGDALAALAALLGDKDAKKIVGVGETGLDYYREHSSREKQRESFRAHLDLARQYNLPVIIHDRDAHADVLQILRRDGEGTRGVMHSFSGDSGFASECIKLGYYISLSGPVTFRKAADKHEVARAVPIDWLLIETDAPFLTPEPYRGRRNEPAYLSYTAQAIARLRDIPLAEVARATTANTQRLFGVGG
ncbi:MAG: TatD family hydrolase [Chloroflexi bacterium]|nr:TatD family hydrolase [Chloroflexota bacterium]